MNKTDWPDELNLFEYFRGETMAYGLFEDRFGNIRRLFTVAIKGTVLDDQLTLEEDFFYEDGEFENRTWVIKRGQNAVYSGTAGDVLGRAEGKQSKARFAWRYDMLLNVSGRQHKVKFDDWMFLMPNNVLLNRAVVKKFGIKLGTVFISFSKDTKI
ncbi:DUF3833 family protein [Neptuniibacter sp. QD48_11]|uniref:DUF3833 family protein n=1 Tax=unclassified Neptuniibacter TaxID=2630693 RepID=UPI0039F52464